MARTKRAYATEKERKAARAEDRKRWLEKNRDARREWERAYLAKNRERISQRRRQWMRENPDKPVSWVEDRRARILGAESSHTEAEWRKLCAFFDFKCLCCRRTDVRLTRDHVVPLSLGGRHSIDNIQPLCLSCNCKKGQKEIDYRASCMY